MIFAALLVLAASTFAFKAAGPVIAAGRTLPTGVRILAELLPAGLLAALVATHTVVMGSALVADARLVGVGAAALTIALRAPFAVVVVTGAGVTALARLLGMA